MFCVHICAECDDNFQSSSPHGNDTREEPATANALDSDIECQLGQQLGKTM